MSLEDAEATRYERDGYVLRRGVLSSDECAGLNERLSALVARVAEEHRSGVRESVDSLDPWTILRRSAHGLGVMWAGRSDAAQRSDGAQDSDGAQGSDRQLGEQDVMRVGHALHSVDARFDAACRHDGLGPVLAELASPDPRLVSSAIIYKQPESDVVQFGLHRDASFITTTPESLVLAFIALDAMDLDNGCLELAPGSHRSPLRTILRLGDGGFEPVTAGAQREPELPTVALPMDAGDVVFVHGRTFHRSGPNTSTRPRRALIVHAMSGASELAESTWLRAPPGGFALL